MILVIAKLRGYEMYLVMKMPCVSPWRGIMSFATREVEALRVVLCFAPLVSTAMKRSRSRTSRWLCERGRLPSLPCPLPCTLRTEYPCNTACGCDYVKYSPVCSIADGTTTFISACHAGCTQEISMPQGTTKKVYGGCTCIAPMNGTIPAVLKDIVSQLNISSINHTSTSTNQVDGGIAISGSCPVDCATKFYAFLAVVCLLKFVGATGRASNFLVSIRCVEEKDKTFSMGFGLALMSLFSFIPSPILFGIILDSTCLVWGRTCTGTGNCWLYNGASLRYLLNFTAAAFVTIGTAFDGGVWYYAKNLKIFDDHEDTKKEMEDAELAVEMDEVARATGGEA